MSIINTFQVKLFKQLTKILDIAGKVFRAYRRVFSYRNWFTIAGIIGKHTQSGFSQIPDFFQVGREDDGEMVSVTGIPHLLFQVTSDGKDLLFRFPCKFNDQDP
jgi:hypothetical protein